MPVAAPPGFTLGAIKPEDAIAVFEQRKLLRPSFRWMDVYQEEHTRGFAVAGVMRLDILADLREATDNAVNNGGSLQDFVRQAKAKLQAKGWWGNIEITNPETGEVRKTRFDDARLQLIFDVNMRQSHAAGRWQRIQRSNMPFIVYRTMRDERVRASHKAWDNVVLPKDHPWWDTHYPPCGWRCRCIAFAIDQSGLDQLRANAPADAQVKTEPPPTQWVEFVNKSTGQTERVPRGIDPGFAYNPGKLHVQRGTELLERTLASVQATAPKAGNAMQVVRAVVARGRTEKSFKEFLAKPPKTGPGGPVGHPVAALPSMAGEPGVASVNNAQLIAQSKLTEFPKPLPTTVAGWAIAQAIIDQGQRLELATGRVLWWWARGSGDKRRVYVLELQRSALVWWVQRLLALTTEEAARDYPKLSGLL